MFRLYFTDVADEYSYSPETGPKPATNITFRPDKSGDIHSPEDTDWVHIANLSVGEAHNNHNVERGFWFRDVNGI